MPRENRLQLFEAIFRTVMVIVAQKKHPDTRGRFVRQSGQATKSAKEDAAGPVFETAQHVRHAQQPNGTNGFGMDWLLHAARILILRRTARTSILQELARLAQ